VKASELGLNLILGGHYATEVFGVRHLAGRLRISSESSRAIGDLIKCDTCST
jgi:putative NIF3 family GTP cyclohydrolase 1 type 2